MAPFVSNLKRTYWNVTDLEKYHSDQSPLDPYPDHNELCVEVDAESANTIGSLIKNSGHLQAPAIDIDWHCEYRYFQDRQELDIWCRRPALHDEEIISYLEELQGYTFIKRALFSGNIHYRLEFTPETQLVLVPSKTPDHFHLYIETILAFNHYVHFLEILERLGIVQAGFRAMTQRRKMSHLRKPNAELFVISS